MLASLPFPWGFIKILTIQLFELIALKSNHNVAEFIIYILDGHNGNMLRSTLTTATLHASKAYILGHAMLLSMKCAYAYIFWKWLKTCFAINGKIIYLNIHFLLSLCAHLVSGCCCATALSFLLLFRSFFCWTFDPAKGNNNTPVQYVQTKNVKAFKKKSRIKTEKT